MVKGEGGEASIHREIVIRGQGNETVANAMIAVEFGLLYLIEVFRLQ
jgi:hypothetical protein